MNTLVRHNRSEYLSWLALLALILYQFHLFHSYLNQAIIGFYPINFDQASYLSYSYGLFENIKTHQFAAVLKDFPANTSRGILFPLNALLYFSLMGASRFSALLPNFVYFALLQCLIFYTVKKISGKNYLGFLFLGLILTLNTPFITGGIADFRMDFIAFSFYGIFASAIIQSNTFLNRTWTLIALGAAVLLILLRFITAIYLIMDISVLTAYFAYQYFFSLRSSATAKTRFINIILFGAILGGLILFYVYLQKDALYKYYIVGQITGAESMYRGMPAGSSFLSYIFYYPSAIANFHISTTGIHAIAIMAITSLLLYLYCRKSFLHSLKESSAFSWKNGCIFLAITILLPLIPLTLDPARSVVVAGIVVIPLLWLLIWPLLYIDKCILIQKHNYYLNTILGVLSAFILYLGLQNQIYSFNLWKSDPVKQKDLPVITKMYLDIGNYATQKHWDKVMLSFDHMIDYMTYANESILYYETYGKLLNADTPLIDKSILSMTKEEALLGLKSSNVVILTIGKHTTDSSYPFNQAATLLSPTLIKYANQHFNKLGEYTFMGYQYRVYVR